MKPLIGINVDISEGPPRLATVNDLYYSAILKAGGIPVLIPPMPAPEITELLSKLNGVLFIGGADYCPSLYGERPSAKVCLADRERIEFDLQLLQQVVKETNLPVLGICAGSQILNIGLGGSLIQDIPDDVGTAVIHSSKDGWSKGWHTHTVHILPDTKLAHIYKTRTISVPTSHHQAVKKAGKGLVVAAKADDDVIEAVELENRPFVIGVQWHPERDYSSNKSLFVEFVTQAAQHRAGSL